MSDWQLFVASVDDRDLNYLIVQMDILPATIDEQHYETADYVSEYTVCNYVLSQNLNFII